ncbi:MAG: response regulator [Magnetococcales bacterium]|nr:response regulator [Magnetococcales bacterium]
MKTVLVIDHDASVRSLMYRILEEEGFHAVGAPNGVIGMQLYRELEPDLVVTGIIMPEKDGIEVIIEVLEQKHSAPVMAVSGGSRGLDAAFNLDFAQRFGAVTVLPKPFSRREFLNEVNKSLETGRNSSE